MGSDRLRDELFAVLKGLDCQPLRISEGATKAFAIRMQVRERFGLVARSYDGYYTLTDAGRERLSQMYTPARGPAPESDPHRGEGGDDLHERSDLLSTPRKTTRGAE